jgi:hypothetical protein
VAVSAHWATRLETRLIVLKGALHSKENNMMEKRPDRLANTLNKRQLSQNLVPEEIIDVCSDDETIEGYVKCCYCGEKLADGALLDHIIAVSKSVDHFFSYFDFFHFCEGAAGAKTAVFRKDISCCF